MAEQQKKAEQEIAMRDAKIEQYSGKISMLQFMIEKYQYQLHAKDTQQSA